MQLVISLLSSTFILVCLQAPSQVYVQAISGTQQTQASLQTDPCGSQTANFSLTPELWNSAGIDQYIAQHPTAKNQTVSEFAASLGMPNFYCGIGLECMAGQLCYPAIGKDYLIIYAIQQWNNFMNQLYSAISSVIMTLSDTSSSVVTDFIPTGTKTDTSVFGWAVATLVFSILGVFTGPLVPAFLPAKAIVSTAGAAKAASAAKDTAIATKGIKQATSAADVTDAASLRQFADRAGDVSNYPRAKVDPAITNKMANVLDGPAQTAAPRRFKRDLDFTPVSQSTPHLEKRGPPNVLAYTRWSFLDIHLGRLRTRIHNFIALTVTTALTSPVYSDAGIAPSLAQGVFLAPNPTWESTVNATKELGNIVLVSELFVSVGYIATIGQDTCDQTGPGGAWKGDDVLSHCDEKGVMRAIVMVKEDKLDKNIRNGFMLKQKYGYNVQDLVNQAYACQTKYGVYGHNNASTPVKASSPCAFQLPVCDMTTPGFKQRKIKKDRLAKACREEYNLPI